MVSNSEINPGHFQQRVAWILISPVRTPYRTIKKLIVVRVLDSYPPSSPSLATKRITYESTENEALSWSGRASYIGHSLNRKRVEATRTPG